MNPQPVRQYQHALMRGNGITDQPLANGVGSDGGATGAQIELGSHDRGAGRNPRFSQLIFEPVAEVLPLVCCQL